MVFGFVPFVFVRRCCGFAENKVAVCLFFLFRLLSVSSIFSCGVFLACAFCLCQVVQVELPVFFRSVEVCYNFQVVLLVLCLLSFLVVFEIFRLWFFCLVFALFAWLRFW